MNAVNSVMRGLFDVLMTPFELLGAAWALVLGSGIAGILALIVFKHISWQAGIKGVKDKIKGNMIAIRIYQDDLVIVARSVINVLLRNFQYLGLNFGPILPLLAPFALVLAQFVVRYAYDPLPVVPAAQAAEMMSGEGTMITIEMKPGQESQAADLDVTLPEGLVAITPLVRSGATGKAFLEVVATESVRGDIEILVGNTVVGTKAIVAGDEPTRTMQPRRTNSFWWSWLLPAEDTFEADGPLQDVTFLYPSRDLGWLPGGEGGIVLVFLLASMAFGAAMLKPLKIQI